MASHYLHYQSNPKPNMASIPRPFFRSFKDLGRTWFKRTRPRTFEGKPNFEFTIASYNVLADKLLHDHPHLYFNRGNRDSWIFDWNYRKKNLIAEIIYSNADILCLQEVQEEHFYNWFNPKLKECGYTGIYNKRSGNKEDGCATFFKHDIFCMERHELVSFNKPKSNFMNRDNVAILVVLQPRAEIFKTNTPICVGNTHLLFNTKRGDIKLAQLAHLFAEVDRLSTDCRSNLPVILCGDFNSTPFSPLYDFLIKGELKFDGISKTVISGQDGSAKNESNYALRDNVFPPDLGLTHTCKWRDSVQKQNGINNIIDLTSDNDDYQTYLKEERGILKHDLELNSCYMHRGLDGSREVTTCHDKACSTVDYILYSNGKKKDSGGHSLWVSGVMSLLSEHEVHNMGKLPNKNLSSDHLMLMSSFVMS